LHPLYRLSGPEKQVRQRLNQEAAAVMQYTISALPTRYRGRTYRSRLEAGDTVQWVPGAAR
jgi:hypothetical protein